MALKEFEKQISKELRLLQARLNAVKYSYAPPIYTRISDAVDEMLLDLEKEGRL